MAAGASRFFSRAWRGLPASDFGSSSASRKPDDHPPDLGPYHLPLPDFHDVFRAMLGWNEDLGYISRVHGQEFNSFRRQTRSKHSTSSSCTGRKSFSLLTWTGDALSKSSQRFIFERKNENQIVMSYGNQIHRRRLGAGRHDYLRAEELIRHSATWVGRRIRPSKVKPVRTVVSPLTAFRTNCPASAGATLSLRHPFLLRKGRRLNAFRRSDLSIIPAPCRRPKVLPSQGLRNSGPQGEERIRDGENFCGIGHAQKTPSRDSASKVRTKRRPTWTTGRKAGPTAVFTAEGGRAAIFIRRKMPF
jgi:hypothetical protein